MLFSHTKIQIDVHNYMSIMIKDLSYIRENVDNLDIIRFSEKLEHFKKMYNEFIDEVDNHILKE